MVHLLSTITSCLLVTACLSSTPSFPHRRTSILARTPTSSTTTQLISRKTKKTKKSKSSSTIPDTEYEPDLIPAEENDLEEVPSLEEIRASLGPFGRTVAASVEVGIVTAGSYVSGAVLGYGIGGVMGVKNLFVPPGAAEETVKRGMIEETKQRIGSWNSKALAQAGQWGKLSAAFSGFHALSRVVRGGKEDKWNGIIGSAATGAYLSRKGGPQAMVQGSASYAGITYLLDKFVGGGGRGAQQIQQQDNFEFTDAPIEEYN